MNLDTLLPFLVTAAITGHFQTVAGFGLGMILIGATSGLGTVPVATTATIVSLLLVENGAVALPRQFGDMRWPLVGSGLICVIPAMLFGVVLLQYLGSGMSGILRVALGVFLIYSTFGLLRTPNETC